MDDCIFCKIIKGEIPSAQVWENEEFLAFLTITPIKPGHTLIIPKKHTDYIFDLDDDLLGRMFTSCKPIAKAIKQAFEPKTGKVGIMVAGLAVPHAHIHLIPMDEEKDLDFNKAKKDIPFQVIMENAQKIRQILT